MTIDVRALAIRFADLWAVDPHQMVEEIYAADILMENMANPTRLIHGDGELHAVEDSLTERIPNHRHELVRVIVDGSVACLETTVVAPLTGEYAPACVWWWLDATGKVAAEVGWFDWADRSTDSRHTHGTVPPGVPGRSRVRSWYEQMAAAYARGWSQDPTDVALDQFAPGCTFGRVGVDEASGVAELRRQRQHLRDSSVAARTMHVQRAIGEGAALAMLVTIDDGTMSTRGTVILTFDADDRIISERTYCDWRKAERTDADRAASAIGSAGWTLESIRR